jgi:hypothetical protein
MLIHRVAENRLAVLFVLRPAVKWHVSVAEKAEQPKYVSQFGIIV